MAMGLRPFADPTARDAPGRPILPGELGVAHGLAVRNRSQPLPDLVLKGRAGHPQRQLEIAELALEVSG